jgi:CRISPR/Cas system-associated protein Cas10 (large subunit of type III CRISPR-Cas system)
VPKSLVYRDVELPVSVTFIRRCAMADKSEIIKKYSIKKGLDAFHKTFNSTYEDLGDYKSLDVTQHFDNESKALKQLEDGPF